MFVRQLDIKTAFLNGELDPDLDLYCHQPEGFSVLGPDGSPLVCKLIKSLYGLKQAPRAWSQLVISFYTSVVAGRCASIGNSSIFCKDEISTRSGGRLKAHATDSN